MFKTKAMSFLNFLKYSGITFLLIFLFSCSSKDASNGAKENLEQNRKFLKITIKNLRVRSTPDLEGAVLERLPENSILEYMNDSTNFTTELSLNGQNYDLHWYRVKTESGNDGWIYGAGVEFLTDEENKRVFVLKTDELSGGQGSGKGKISSQTAPQINQALVDQYRTELLRISFSDADAVNKAIRAFEITFGGRPSATADLAFADFLEFHLSVLNFYLSNTNLNSYQFLYDEIKNYGSTDMERDPTTRLLHSNGLRFDIDQKSKINLSRDLDFLMRRFLKLITSSSREFLEQMELESEQRIGENKISANLLTEISANTVFWDKFLMKYPYSPLKKEVLKKRKYYAQILLKGNSADPAFKSKFLDKKFMDSYEIICNRMGSSPFINSMQSYLELLKKRKFKETNEVLSKRDEILEQL